MVYIKIENGLPVAVSFKDPIEKGDGQILFKDGEYFTVEDMQIPLDFDGDDWDAIAYEDATELIEAQPSPVFWAQMDVDLENLPVFISTEYPGRWFRYTKTSGFNLETHSIKGTTRLKYADPNTLFKNEELLSQKIEAYKRLQKELNQAGIKI